MSSPPVVGTSPPPRRLCGHLIAMQISLLRAYPFSDIPSSPGLCCPSLPCHLHPGWKRLRFSFCPLLMSAALAEGSSRIVYTLYKGILHTSLYS